MKAYVQIRTHAPNRCGYFVPMGPNWKQRKRPSTGECIYKLWHIHAMEYNSAIKRNNVLICATEYMNLKTIMFLESSQGPQNLWCMVPVMWNSREGKLISDEGKQMGGCLRLKYGGCWPQRDMWAYLRWWKRFDPWFEWWLHRCINLSQLVKLHP